MTVPYGFEDWVRNGKDAEPPPGFADLVMERVRALASSHAQAVSENGRLRRMVRASTAAAAVFALAFGLGMTRNGLLLLMVLFTPGKGL